MKKKLRVIADKILMYEKKCQAGENISENLLKIEEITQALSIEDMCEIDEYIMSKRTK